MNFLNDEEKAQLSVLASDAMWNQLLTIIAAANEMLDNSVNAQRAGGVSLFRGRANSLAEAASSFGRALSDRARDGVESCNFWPLTALRNRAMGAKIEWIEWGREHFGPLADVSDLEVIQAWDRRND